jgi:hypothetical protein
MELQAAANKDKALNFKRRFILNIERRFIPSEIQKFAPVSWRK